MFRAKKKKKSLRSSEIVNLYSSKTCGMLHRCVHTVRKHTPCKLSFVYTSYIRYGVLAVSKFGKHTSLFSLHKDKKYV